MKELILQGIIFLSGPVILWLISCKGERLRWWGFSIGLVTQPAWFVETSIHRQWGLLGLSIVYFFIYIRGLVELKVFKTFDHPPTYL
jgi:hypothetical protein